MSRTVIPLRKSAVESSLKLAAFEQLPLPALCVNDVGQVLAVNAAFCELSGKPAPSLVGRSLLDLVPASGRARLARGWARLQRRLRTDLATRGQLRWTAENTRRLTLAIDAQKIAVDEDLVACLTVRDVTGEYAERCEQRRRRIRTAVLERDGAYPTVLLGADRRVLEHNAAAATIIDDPSIDTSGLLFDDLLDEVSAAPFRRDVAALIGSPGESTALELRLRRRGRATGAWLECTISNRLSEPAVAALVVRLRDVGEIRELRQRLDRVERRLRAFVTHVADVLLVLDDAGTIRYQSPAVARTLGLLPESNLGRPISSLVAPADQARLAQALLNVKGDAASARSETLQARLIGADGISCLCWVTLVNLSADLSIGGLLLTARDIGAASAGSDADAGRQARRLELRERLLELAVRPQADSAGVVAHVLRTAAESLRVNAASFWLHNAQNVALRCEAMFDARQERFAHDWIGVEFPAPLYPSYLAKLRKRQPLAIDDLVDAGELSLLSQQRRWATVRAVLDTPILVGGDVRGVLSLHCDSPCHWDEDAVNFMATAALMVALALEAAQRQEAESRIEQLAWYDPLTGLPNRNLLRETLRDMVMSASNRGRRIALMLIDLDRFKDVNDTLGHLVGDALIKSAAQLLREMVGERGVVGRLGGDEFVVVLNEFEQQQEVALFAARITQALHRTDLLPNVDTQVSASIGIALFPEHGREMSTLMKNADSAMYQAKRDGRNQFSFFNPIRHEHAAREVQLGIQLFKALQGSAPQFFVEYQPQVQMATGRVIGIEALIRWQHPTHGRLTPDRFIRVAEASGLSERITRWLFGEVCSQILNWRAKHPGFEIPIAINVAGRELSSPSLPAIVRGALSQSGIEPSMIALEINERTLVKENETNNDVMAELVSIGVKLVLDDFGTGYSMLGYLKRMPIQALKIDASYVKGVPDDADSCAIVHAVLAVARHFRLKVVAEGIETSAQVAYLREVGCEYGQGFYYSRPLPPQPILEYLELGAADDVGRLVQ